MSDISFLRIHPSLEVAQDLQESPAARIRYTSQIQFLPFDPQPYLQVTASDLTLSVGPDYKVYIVDCHGIETEVTAHVLLRDDLVPGQLVIKLSYLPRDFGTQPVYLKIDRYGNGIKKYFSNLFLITSHNAHLTSRLDYLSRTRNIPQVNIASSFSYRFQSVRLQFYFDQVVDATEVETYYQITRSQTKTPRISVNELSQWKTLPINGWTLTRLARALYAGKCYINQTRNYITEGLERNKREGMSNISETEFLTAPDDTDRISIITEYIGPQWSTQAFLASSGQLARSGFLSSQSTITIPI